MRVFSFLLVVVVSSLQPTTLFGQWPGEVSGVVRDALTGSPVVGASVELVGGRQTVTDPSGRFRFVGLAPGPATLSIDAPGYVGRQLETSVRNGRTDSVDIPLRPSPLMLAPIEASGRVAVASAGTVRLLERAQIERSARTLGDAIRVLPGVVVSDRGLGSAQTLSVRGSDANAVLVLLDGVPMNDPITGEADLSTVPADAIETAQLHLGANSSRFGPQALGGVLDVRTGRKGEGWTALAGTGSLGASEVRIERASSLGAWNAGASAAHRKVGGDFDFSLPTQVGGGEGQRVNADHRLTSLQFHADRAGATHVRIRVGGDRVERGLPGPGFNPSVHARQEATTARASVSLGRPVRSASVRSVAYVTHARRRFVDFDPSAGPAYDERTRLSEASLDLSAQWGGRGRLTSLQVGSAISSQWITSDGLVGGPGAIVDVGSFAAASFDPGLGGTLIQARLRLDGAGAVREWRPSHTLTLVVPTGPLSIELSHRSAFSPPTLADQFFREGVGVRPNPDLRAERIRSEFELSTRFASEVVQFGGGAYVGDVEGRIVWQPDFRFVWSPTNTDVRRRGVDAWIALQPTRSLSLRGSYTYARSTYDREGSADSVQLAYRPRHSGSTTAGWSTGQWSVDGTAFFTGTRFPVPAPVNALPSFVAVDISASRKWSGPAWSTDVTLGVHRALGTQDSLIFGFPDPGRTFALDVRVRREHNPSRGPR